ncbi:MAG: hypothetical protein LBN95_14295 [Prevotellaceae bacterium]|jgi:hypothetical protein|nr:hypothetical protein [Prevotellaceae bacterium]
MTEKELERIVQKPETQALYAQFKVLYDKWKEDRMSVKEEELYALFDKFPSQLVANTVFKSHRYDEDEVSIFTEEVVLPYCLERGIVQMDKKGYLVNCAEAAQMPELDFK